MIWKKPNFFTVFNVQFHHETNLFYLFSIDKKQIEIWLSPTLYDKSP